MTSESIPVVVSPRAVSMIRMLIVVSAPTSVVSTMNSRAGFVSVTNGGTVSMMNCPLSLNVTLIEPLSVSWTVTCHTYVSDRGVSVNVIVSWPVVVSSVTVTELSDTFTVPDSVIVMTTESAAGPPSGGESRTRMIVSSVGGTFRKNVNETESPDPTVCGWAVSGATCDAPTTRNTSVPVS